MSLLMVFSLEFLAADAGLLLLVVLLLLLLLLLLNKDGSGVLH